MTEEQLKIRENRLRRAAARQGLRLLKTRRRDPLALDFGTYGLADDDGIWVHADPVRGYGLTLDQIEHALKSRGQS